MNKSGGPYMILVSTKVQFFHVYVVPRGEGAEEVPDLPLAVAPTGTGLARGSERVKTPHLIHFYTKCHMSNGVKF